LRRESIIRHHVKTADSLILFVIVVRHRRSSSPSTTLYVPVLRPLIAAFCNLK
jgi:hypothetical protein